MGAIHRCSVVGEGEKEREGEWTQRMGGLIGMRASELIEVESHEGQQRCLQGREMEKGREGVGIGER